MGREDGQFRSEDGYKKTERKRNETHGPQQTALVLLPNLHPSIVSTVPRSSSTSSDNPNSLLSFLSPSSSGSSVHRSRNGSSDSTSLSVQERSDLLVQGVEEEPKELFGVFLVTLLLERKVRREERATVVSEPNSETRRMKRGRRARGQRTLMNEKQGMWVRAV